MKTAHQLARELLAGPDLPVVTLSAYLEGDVGSPVIREYDDGDRRFLLIAAEVEVKNT